MHQGGEILLKGSIVTNPMVSPVQQYSNVWWIPTFSGLIDFSHMDQLFAIERQCRDKWASQGSTLDTLASCVATNEYVMEVIGFNGESVNVALPDLP